MPERLSRREFVKTGVLASGLVLAVQLPAWARSGLAAAAARGATLSPSAYLQLTPDGLITLWITRSEMGQGVHTALAMIVAEELEVGVGAVTTRQAPVDSRFATDQGYTGGSNSVSGLWQPLRLASAQAREMLVGAAARTWGVPTQECRASNGRVTHAASRRSAAYGELVPVAAALKPPAEPRLKQPGEFRLLGRATKRIEAPSKVDGTARYGIDVRLPGMLRACTARCPVFGREITGYDDSAARAVPGVREVVRLPPGEIVLEEFWRFAYPAIVVVLADSTWAAMQGCRALECAWDSGPEERVDSARLSRLFRDRALQGGVLGRNEGDAAAALAGAATSIEAVYELPFLAHAAMEPMNCTADVRPGRCDVYTPTQVQSWVQALAERLTGLPPDAVTVHTTLLGGGFGRRLEADYAIDAIRISQAVGRPVQVVWTREQDMQHDVYRPASYHLLKGGLDGSGRLMAWSHRVVAPSIMAYHAPLFLKQPDAAGREILDGAEDLPYAIPHLRVEGCPISTPVPVGWWRSVYASQNCFVNESFFDELARAAGRDPFELRHELLAESPRLRRVLELVGEKAGWGRPLPQGQARGVAIHKLFCDSVVAEVAEVSIEGGAVRVHRVTCAVDCGLALNPDAIAAQMESSVVYGLSAALKGAITIEGGLVKQSNFHDYPVLRMNEMPRVEVHIVESSEPPHGVGEPGVPPIAPAVGNAVAQLTGKPVRRLPIALA